jgi:hypothetical protein
MRWIAILLATTAGCRSVSVNVDAKYCVPLRGDAECHVAFYADR